MSAPSKVSRKSGRKRDRRWHLDTDEEESQHHATTWSRDDDEKKQPAAAVHGGGVNTSSNDNDDKKRNSKASPPQRRSVQSSSLGKERHHRKRKKKSSTRNNKEMKPPKQTLLLPLAGKLIAVTSLQSHNPKDDAETNDRHSDDNNDINMLTYAQLVEKCRREAGADTTSQAHKRVYCLVATQCAITGETQRVRKAWKLNIPVVRVTWLQDCIQQGKCVDFGLYLVPPPKNIQKRKKEAPKKAVTAPKGVDRETVTVLSGKGDGDDDDDADDQDAGWSEQVDLGCCCVCHENAPAGTTTDCAWCVECSVNLACNKL